MRNFINHIKADKLTYRGFILSFILLFSSLGFVVFYFNKLPLFIPLFNQLPWGDARVTPTIYILIPIFLYGLFIIGNIIFTSIVYNKNPLIGRMFASTTLLLGAMNFIFLLRTIMEII